MINPGRFDLVSLRVFVAVVEAGSLTAGAERFGISLAAASKRMVELERGTRVQLLERSKKGITTTAAGQTFFQHALKLVADLEQLAMAMGDYGEGVLAHVRLWANTSAVNGCLPPVLAAFLAKHPTVKIDLQEALSDAIVRAVSSGAADLGVFDGTAPAPGLQTVVCDSDELVLLVPPRHALARRRSVHFSVALGYDFIGLERNSALVRLTSAAADAEGRSLKMRVQVRSFDAMCRLIAADVGIGVLPRAAAIPHVSSMRLAVVALRDSWAAERSLLLGYRSLEALSPAARALALLIQHGNQAASE
jgi:DNA-binding transcriptional LysR family regulator